MDDGKRTTETHLVPAHGTTTLTVVYTNDEATVETTLARFEQLLEKEKHKFVGLDLEYTRANKRKNPPQEIAVVQIAIHEEVLVYHFCRKEITFTSVDITNDTIMLSRALIKIPEGHHIDIQNLYKIKSYLAKDGMGDLAAEIIDKSYEKLKKLKRLDHDYWEWKSMSQARLEYAARDTYMAYELYSKLITMKDGMVKAGFFARELCPGCKLAQEKKHKEDRKRFQDEQGSWDGGDIKRLKGKQVKDDNKWW